MQNELRRKISKLGTSSLINKFEQNKFSGEELEIAKEFLTKRDYRFQESVEPTTAELNLELENEPKQPEIQAPVKKVPKEKKLPKREKKMYKDENGKELTKSMLMRRLVRKTVDLKPKELNEELKRCGFTKAYHSEIQRCRKQMGIKPSKQ